MIDVDRATGALLMLTIGDALGAPVDGLKGPHIRQLFGGQIKDYADARIPWSEKLHRWRLRGLHTGPAQQAFMMTEVLLDNARWDARSAAEWLTLFGEPAPDLPHGLHRSATRELRLALKRLREASPPLQSGTPSPSAEAAARVAPLGVWFAETPDALIDAAMECALLTTTDARAILSAAVAALAVAAGLIHDTSKTAGAAAAARWIVSQAAALETRLNELAERAGVTVSPDCAPVSGTIESLPGLLEEGDATLARQTLLNEANRHGPDHVITSPNQPFAPMLVPAALWRALSARSPLEALIDAVNEGYDTPRACAITGAIVGARFGAGAAPAEWVAGLLGADLAVVRGEALAVKAPDPARWDELYTVEYQWTLRESTERQELARAHDREVERRREKQTAHRQALQKVRPESAPTRPGKPKSVPDPSVARSDEDRAALRRERQQRDKQRGREREHKRLRDRRSDFIARGRLALEDRSENE